MEGLTKAMKPGLYWFKGIHMSNTLKAFYNIEDAREQLSQKPSDKEFWAKARTRMVNKTLHAIEEVYLNLHDTQETQRDVLSPEQVQKIRNLLVTFDEWRGGYYNEDKSAIKLERTWVVTSNEVAASLVACLYFATAYNVPQYILTSACSTAAQAPEVLENLDKMSVEERIKFFVTAMTGVGVFYNRVYHRRG